MSEELVLSLLAFIIPLLAAVRLVSVAFYDRAARRWRSTESSIGANFSSVTIGVTAVALAFQAANVWHEFDSSPFEEPGNGGIVFTEDVSDIGYASDDEPGDEPATAVRPQWPALKSRFERQFWFKLDDSTDVASIQTQLDGMIASADKIAQSDYHVHFQAYVRNGTPADAKVQVEDFRESLVKSGIDADRVIVDWEHAAGGGGGGAGDGGSPKPDVRILVTPPEPELSYYWNWWMSPDGTWLEPATSLTINTPYEIVIDLAAAEYHKVGVEFHAVHRRFAEVVNAKARKGLPNLKMDVVLLTDGRFTSPADTKPRQLEINLEKVRRLQLQPISPSAVSFDSLAITPEPEWMFGRLRFNLVTGEQKGWASFGISLWYEGRPYDEMVFHRCIGEMGIDCDPDEHKDGLTLGGTELFETADDTSTKRPNAAIHLIELSGNQLVGVFVRNKAGQVPNLEDYLTWKIRGGAKNFDEELRLTQQAFAEATDAPAQIGRAFTNQVFPVHQDDAKAARAALLKFLDEEAPKEPFSETRPSLFIRMLRNREDPSPLYPAALLVLGNEENAFLGYRTRIESPLPDQGYGSTPCPSKWQTLMPRNDSEGPLKDARMAFSDRIPGSKGLSMTVGEAATPIFADMPAFANWIGPPTPTSDTRYPGTLLITVSHHDMHKLYFVKTYQVLSTNVTALVEKNSIAILAGCTTGEQGPGGFVNHLNGAGFRSIIATSTGVSGDLAGKLVNAILSETEQLMTSPITIGDAFEAAQKSLFSAGPSVLSFTLVGNPEAQLCLP
jgi:hypothetical protein